MMATRSEVFGSYVGDVNVLTEIKNAGTWLCCGRNYFEFIFGGKSGSISAVEVGDGARYWKAFWVLWA
jgi:hypothetical protein